jgi:hypothetical protein
MTYGTNAAVAATVPMSAKHVDAALYSMAVRCDTYEEAYKLLRRIEHLLPVPLVKPWRRTEKNQQKVLVTTSQYTQGYTDPADYDQRATEASRSVDEFSKDARKPECKGKISPQRRGPRRIPAEHVCKWCGRSTRLAMHDNCHDLRVDASVLAPKAGMYRGKQK